MRTWSKNSKFETGAPKSAYNLWPIITCINPTDLITLIIAYESLFGFPINFSILFIIEYEYKHLSKTTMAFTLSKTISVIISNSTPVMLNSLKNPLFSGFERSAINPYQVPATTSIKLPTTTPLTHVTMIQIKVKQWRI